MIAQNGDSHLSVVAVAELMEMFTQMALGRIFLNMQMRGAPSHGTMFVAGETGAEIVGHINGKTEVLNQSQIASAIYSAVYSAMSQFDNSQSSEIDVHVHTDEGTVVDRINQRTKQTGVCPINIPVC